MLGGLCHVNVNNSQVVRSTRSPQKSREMSRLKGPHTWNYLLISFWNVHPQKLTIWTPKLVVWFDVSPFPNRYFQRSCLFWGMHTIFLETFPRVISFFNKVLSRNAWKQPSHHWKKTKSKHRIQTFHKSSPYCWCFRNPANQWRLVVYPVIYQGFVASQTGGLSLPGFLVAITMVPKSILGCPRKLGSKVRISGLLHPN